MKVACIADLHDLCGESPLWDYRTSELSWVDITGNRIHRLAYESGAVQSIRSPVPVNALLLTENLDLIVAGADGIALMSRELAVTKLVTEHANMRLSINDAIADPRGRVLAGSTFWDGSPAGFPLGSLYSVDLDGSVRVLDEGFGLANGLGFSPDERTLYFTDSLARTIYSYDYDSQSGSTQNRRIFVQLPSAEGLPDGLTVDREGFVWSAQWFGSCVCRYDPDGLLERRIEIPVQQVSSLTFGGTDFSTIFITSAGQPDALAFAPRGYDIDGARSGGQLFRCECGIQGKPEYLCRVRLNSDRCLNFLKTR